jgi:3-oxoacyl-[acyl-carrier protein] reductase
LTERLEEVLNQRSINEKIDLETIKSQVLSQIPSGKFALAEEVAAAVAFLCSPAAGAINGINLPVDGGLSMSL